MKTSDSPLLSVIVPSYNQGVFLKDTLDSILDQKLAGMEVLLLDGGSTDCTKEVIEAYRDRLDYVVSERDGGQTQAINKGFKRARGEWVCWMNSDDFFLDGCFRSFAAHVKKDPSVDLWYADKVHVDEKGMVTTIQRYHPYWTAGVLADKMNLCNQAAFWKRSMFDRCGFLDETFQYAMDLEFFIRLDKVGQARSKHVYEIWGAQRYHGLTKTSSEVWLKRLADERVRLAKQYGLSTGRAHRMCALGRRLAYHVGRLNPGYVMKSDKRKGILGRPGMDLVAAECQ